MTDAIVLVKKEAASQWGKHTSVYATTYGGKPWRYVLIPHNAIAENMTLDGLAGQLNMRCCKNG